MTHDRDVVRAYVDGELDDISAARIAHAAKADISLAASIAAERQLRDKLGGHFAAVLAEPVPERLTAPIDAARKVVSIGTARDKRFSIHPRTLRWAGPAIAAALVLAVLLPASNSKQTETRDGLTFAANDLEQALDTQLVAAQQGGSETRVMLSFAKEDGTLCRGFARSDLSGIACRETGGWHLLFQRDGIDISTGDYRQASSVDSAIMAAAQDLAAGPPLDAQQERSAKERGWKVQ